MTNLTSACNIRNIENASVEFREFCRSASDTEIDNAIILLKNLSKLNVSLYECANSILWSVNHNSEKGSNEFKNSAKMLNASLK